MLASGQWDGPPVFPGAPPVSEDGDGGKGDSLLGQCTFGERPYYNCVTGTKFVGACGGGSLPDTSNCSQGMFHTVAACDAGGNAATICISGQGQQF